MKKNALLLIIFLALLPTTVFGQFSLIKKEKFYLKDSIFILDDTDSTFVSLNKRQAKKGSINYFWVKISQELTQEYFGEDFPNKEKMNQKIDLFIFLTELNFHILSPRWQKKFFKNYEKVRKHYSDFMAKKWREDPSSIGQQDFKRLARLFSLKLQEEDIRDSRVKNINNLELAKFFTIERIKMHDRQKALFHADREAANIIEDSIIDLIRIYQAGLPSYLSPKDFKEALSIYKKNNPEVRDINRIRNIISNEMGVFI